MRWLALTTASILLLCFSGLALACESSSTGSQPGARPDSSLPTEKPDSACASKVDSQLLQLVLASDPAAFAAQTGGDFQNGTVRVLLELAGGAVLAADPAVRIEGQYGNLVQARIAPGDVCRIAAQPEVVRIQLSMPPVPQ